MFNLQNAMVMHPQSLHSQNSSQPVMVMAQYPFFNAAQTSSIQTNSTPNTQPIIVMATPQIQPAQIQYYLPQQASLEPKLNLIQQQHSTQMQQQQQQLQQQQYFYAQFMQNQQQQFHQQQQLSFQYPALSAQNGILSQIPHFINDPKGFSYMDQIKQINCTNSQMQFTSTQLGEKNNIQLLSVPSVKDNLNVKLYEDSKFVSSQEKISSIESESNKNSKKRTSVTSTTSTASNSTNNNGNDSNWSSPQQQFCSVTQTELNSEDELKKKQFLNNFEPHIQALLKQMHDQSMMPQTVSGNNDTQTSFMNGKQSKRGSCFSNLSDNNGFEEEGLQDLLNQNSYVRWAIHTNRTSTFANESHSSLVSTNHKYNNLFKLKKKIKKQLVNKKLTHPNSERGTKLSENSNFKSLKDHQLHEINKLDLEATQTQTAGCSGGYSKVIQKAEYSEGQLNEASSSQDHNKIIEDDSFDEDICRQADSKLDKKSEKKENNNNNIPPTGSIVLSNLDFLQQLTIKSNPGSYREIRASCTCKQMQKPETDKVNLTNTHDVLQGLCPECIRLSSRLLPSITNIVNESNFEGAIQRIVKKEVIDQTVGEMNEEEENEMDEDEEDCFKGSQSNPTATKSNMNQQGLKEEEENSSRNNPSISKKAINSKFHNMNKLFMYKLLSSFYLENLERLGVPFYIREILKKLISLVKLSSKQQSQYQSKQKTDFFSHDHYNLLFLTLNNQTIQYMRENSNNRILHLSCFNFDLNQINLPLESSSNPRHILEKIEYINVVKRYACEIVLQSDLGEEKDDNSSQQNNQQVTITKQIYTKRALSGIRILNQGMIVRRF